MPTTTKTRRPPGPSHEQMDLLMNLRDQKDIPLELGLKLSSMWPPKTAAQADELISELTPLKRKPMPRTGIQGRRRDLARRIHTYLGTHQAGRNPALARAIALLAEAEEILT